MVRSFTLEYWQDDDWFVGRLREVPGIFSQGETLNELEENIKDAYKQMVAEEELPDTEMAISTKELQLEV